MGEGINALMFMAKHTVLNEKLKDKFDEFEPGGKEKIQKAVHCMNVYLDSHQLGTDASKLHELEAKKKELEDIVNPIMVKVMYKLPFRQPW